MVKIIYTFKNQEILVDDCDYPILNKYSWNVDKDNLVERRNYKKADNINFLDGETITQANADWTTAYAAGEKPEITAAQQRKIRKPQRLQIIPNQLASPILYP